jgi:hypothetical protein
MAFHRGQEDLLHSREVNAHGKLLPWASLT